MRIRTATPTWTATPTSTRPPDAQSGAALRFVTNLRPETVAVFSSLGYQPSAWLLSSHRLDATTLRLARVVRAAGLDLYADNGTKPMIDAVVSRFAADLEGLAREIRAMRRALPSGRRIPYVRELPPGLARRAGAAAEAIGAAVDAELARETAHDLLARQLAMDPTHLIAREDFAVAAMIALGLEREVTRWRVARLDRRNRITLDMWEQAVADSRCDGRRIFATLSAGDYPSARSAARLAARRGVEHVAVGFAGINLDSSFVESHVRGARRLLRSPAPRRYVRTAAILRGIRDGFRDAARPLRSFHALGLGAPAMLPALAAGLDPRTQVSADATSPLHDAVRDLVLYDESAHGERVTVVEGARRTLEGTEPSFASPFMSALRAELGHRPDAARAWWEEAGRPPVAAESLHPSAPLGSSLPAFATARGGLTTRQTRARTAHNHWVMDRLVAEAPGDEARAWALERMDRLIDASSVTTRLGVSAMREVLFDD